MPPAAAKTFKSIKWQSKKAKHGTSVGIAFQRIRDLIVNAKLAPGTWIVEGDLCGHLNMSRTPVRGSLFLLQREGYVIESRNGSKSRMIVAPMTKEDANELYPIIGGLKGWPGAEPLRCRRMSGKPWQGSLKLVNDKLAQIARDRGYHGPDIFDLDHEFHHILLASGSGPRLATLHRAIEPQTERYWRLYASSIISELHVSVAEHEKIIAALLAGDPDRLERALCTNWEKGYKRLARVIEMFGERGSW